ncbi:MAG: asparagine synthase (glutamine-hydrolyzing) [Kiritimatiellae bacterium]|nr:asparagine synthase (glutamine-hydrolyzing) [Kiritimatiellia bacterium]MDD5521811.1 asparagine synthase (glutamine-hydrolyzing) [Kiritimatiellia bacterium]
MCGIVGIFTKFPTDNPNRLLMMRDTMTHRGPNDAGAWWSPDKRLGLAHRRLAVIDLSPAGHQPMEDSTGKFVIILNGEIYNYRELREELLKAGHTFRSSSDTEVLLESYKEWGKNCLVHLIGAFAFAIYDEISQELFLARDRAGEKPLFYKHSDNRFVFASELKALMADPEFPRELDLDALDYYLAYGFVSGDQTILKDTYKLPPAHAMIYSLEKKHANIWRYWELPESLPLSGVSIEDLTEELEAILSGAVRRQLVADVPVGILLSGGLDSSLVTAIAAKVSDQPLKTFTVSFPGHGSFNEGPYARLVADHFGTEHTELVAEPASVLLLPHLAKQYDEPIADHSIVPTSMLAGLVKKSVTVALGGDGGDELFGGYPHYNFLQKIDRLREYVPGRVRRIGSLIASHVLPVGTKGRNHIIGLEGNSDSSISAVNIYFDKESRRKLMSPLYSSGYTSSVSQESMKVAHFDASLSIFQNASRMDFKTTMVDDYLVKSDRAGMLHSLELHAPFLDHKLIEFAFGRLPDSFRADRNERKILLRRLAKRLLPSTLDINRKQGFSLPLNAWFKGEWGTFMTGVLMESDSTIFDKKMIASLIRGQRWGLANANRIFALTMFELWRREYRISLPN